MTVNELIQAVAESGYTIAVTATGPTLVKSRSDALIARELVAALKEQRAAVAIQCGPVTESKCGTCKAAVWLGGGSGRADVGTVCPWRACPFKS